MTTHKKYDLPYMPFYVGDWRKAPDIRALTLEERALWFEMLCLMWESPRRGYLTVDGETPIDDKTLARMIGEDSSVITEIKQVLASVSIYSVEETTGIIYNRRMVKDENIRLSKSIAGKLGMESRYKDKKKEGFCYNTSANKQPNKSLTNIEYEYESISDIDSASKDKDKRGEFQERGESDRKSPVKAISSTKQFIDWYCQEYQSRFGEKYIMSGAKEGSIIKGLLTSISLEDLQDKTIKFFESTDDFILRAGFTIGVFKSQINKLHPVRQAFSQLPEKTRKNIAAYQSIAKKEGWND
uniref:Uncharacterized protein n=1 Tax=viral metagenome TaxID=1070528 RepID=A0A6M3XX50_9ZZZZ